MVKKVKIFYFSGTGNTELIVHMVEKSLTTLGITSSNSRMEDVSCDGACAIEAECDVIGIAYPVHAFNAPRIVFEFISKYLNDGSGKPVFIISTSSGPFEWNDYASTSVRKSLNRKGFNVINEKMFYLSANIAFKFPDSLIKQLYLASLRHSDSFALEVKSLKIQKNPRCFRL